MPILDKPVKTYLMNSVGDALKTITVLRADQVKAGQPIPTDQDIAVFPWTCYFDQPEIKTKRNRIAIKEFDLVIQVWVAKGVTSVDEQMDIIDAEVERTLLEDEDVNHYAMLILPTSTDKLIPDDEETGVLQAIYRATYSHAWKNPYQLEKQ